MKCVLTFTSLAIRVELIADPAGTHVAAERVHTNMVTAMLVLAFVELLI